MLGFAELIALILVLRTIYDAWSAIYYGSGVLSRRQYLTIYQSVIALLCFTVFACVLADPLTVAAFRLNQGQAIQTWALHQLRNIKPSPNTPFAQICGFQQPCSQRLLAFPVSSTLPAPKLR